MPLVSAPLDVAAGVYTTQAPQLDESLPAQHSGCRLRLRLALAIIESRIIPSPVIRHFEVFQRLFLQSCGKVSLLLRREEEDASYLHLLHSAPVVLTAKTRVAALASSVGSL